MAHSHSFWTTVFPHWPLLTLHSLWFCKHSVCISVLFFFVPPCCLSIKAEILSFRFSNFDQTFQIIKVFFHLSTFHCLPIHYAIVRTFYCASYFGNFHLISNDQFLKPLTYFTNH